MRRAVPLVLAVIVLLGSPPLAGSSPSPGSPLPRLAARTTIVASGSASMTVRVPRAAEVHLARHDEDLRGGVTFEGGGPSVVFVLSARRGPAGPTLLLGRTSKSAVCRGEPCPLRSSPTVGAIWDMDFDEQSRTVTIPPGTYTLAMVVPEGRARLVLRLDGLDGTVLLQPRASRRPGHRLLRFEGPTEESSWASASAPLGPSTTGLVWSSMWVRMPVSPAGGQYRYCLYGREPEPGPACPFAHSISFTDAIVGPVRSWVLVQGFSYPIRGRAGQKLAYTAGGDVDHRGAIAMSVPLIEAPGDLPFLSLGMVYWRWFEDLGGAPFIRTRSDARHSPVVVPLP